MTNVTAIVQIPIHVIDTTKEEVEDNWRQILLEQIRDPIVDADLVKMLEDKE